ncbi:MAG: ArsB/NhaD family transporter, partial [Methanomassiliicoccales archaeon]
NIGSVATPVGNPQNAYIATVSGISFVEFSMALMPTAMLSLVVAMVIIWLIFRKDLCDENGHCLRIDAEGVRTIVNFEGMDRSVWIVLVIMFSVFLGFIASDFLRIPLAVVAFIGGSVALFILPLFNRKTNARSILAGVDWTLLLFFVGLFIVLEGVSVSGLLEEMMTVFQSAVDGGLTQVPGLTLFTALLSNLISNVPAVILLSPFVSTLGDNSLWIALAASSTLAGNATILGAAANVIVAESGERLGADLPFWKFVKAGLPITIATLFISVLILEIM